MRRLLLALMLVLSGASAAPALTTDQQEDICAPANTWVIWCENWQNWPLGAWANIAGQSKFKMPGWGVSQPNGLDIVANGPTAGGKSLRFEYPAGSNNTGGGFGDSSWGGNNRGLYYRAYSRYSANFIISPSSTKHWELNGFNGMFATQFGNGTPNMSIVGFQYPNAQEVPGGVQLPAYNWYPNLNGGGPSFPALADDQWHCYEVHWVNNTFNGPDAFGGSTPNSDGVLEWWIDGVQYGNRTGLLLNPGNDGSHHAGFYNTALTNTLISAYWNNENLTSFHPLMYRYDTNFVVATARIGCLGAVVPPTTPNPPTNLQISKRQAPIQLGVKLTHYGLVRR